MIHSREATAVFFPIWLAILVWKLHREDRRYTYHPIRYEPMLLSKDVHPAMYIIDMVYFDDCVYGSIYRYGVYEKFYIIVI